MRHGFWPLVHSYEYPWSSQSFPSDNTAGVSSRIFTVKNIYPIPWHWLLPLHASALLHWLLWLSSDTWKSSVSNFAEFKSFLLIMCIDAPESTTNSLSSGLILDGEGRHYVNEKDVFFFFFSVFWIFFANFHAASRAQCSCHYVSSWDRSSNFGAFGVRWWGSPGQNLLSDGFRSRTLAQRIVVLVSRTLRFGFCKVELFRKIDEDFGGSMSWNTQPKFFVSLTIATALFFAILFRPFAGLLFNSAVCEDALIPEFASRLCPV